VHPVQIYESIVCFALFLFLWRLSKRKRFDGEIILTYAALYAVARFLLEYFRGDADRGFVFGGTFSTSQFIALPIFAAAIIVVVIRLKKRKRISDS
jgi:phosphatidylglycerol---prolipoprotein diacylglyceryl transferase